MPPSSASISVIVPTLNEAGTIEATLAPLQQLRREGHEVIVVDGGSDDMTALCCRALADRVLHAPPGRAGQMQRGADSARGEVLWFLHADTLATVQDADAIIDAVTGNRRPWGYFRVRFKQPGRLLHLVAWMMNHRSRLTRIATGDQGIFVTRALFREIQGYQAIPLMEDVALCRSLKTRASPACLPQTLTTSARRWRRYGVVRTIVLMWSLRLAYFLGVHPDVLVRYYPSART